MRILTVLLSLAAFGACSHSAPKTSTVGVTAAELRARDPMFEELPLRVDAAPPLGQQALEEWRARNPISARLLDDWRETYPQTAERLARWSEREPQRFETLVMWSATNREQPLGSFFMTRNGYDELAAIAGGDPDGVEAFLHWARASGSAACDLSRHVGGLRAVEVPGQTAASPP